MLYLLELTPEKPLRPQVLFLVPCAPSTGSPGLGAKQEAVPCSRRGAVRLHRAPAPRVIKELAVIENSPASPTVSTLHYCLMYGSY